MKKTLLILLFVCSFVSTYAQELGLDSLREKRKQVNYAYIQLYKENGEMSYTSPFGEIGAPSGYVINGKLTTSYQVVASGSLPIAFSIDPDFTVRVRTDRSAGVRTPSFRLGGTFYARLAKDWPVYRYVTLSFTHHSNGQDGDAVSPDGSINTQTGNFNANYLTMAYHFGHFNKQAISNQTYAFHHKVGLSWHKWFNYEPALNGDYGFTRLGYDFSFRIYRGYAKQNIVEKETWRLNGQFSYAVNKYATQGLLAVKRRLNTELSANYSLAFMPNVFLMASFGYYGEDPYNIYFKDHYAYMRFGLSSTFSRYKVK